MTRLRRLAARLAAALVLVAVSRLEAQTTETGGPGGSSGTGGGGQTGGSGTDEEAQFPAPLGDLFDATDPARLQRRLDEILGLDTERSSKPRGPELPLALFVESVRPLGALKYENQLNYFVSPFSGSAPTFQSLTYEYVFADWNAARIEFIAPRPGRVDALGFGYQRTFGVGRDHNWAHGALILPEVSIRGTGFIGGSAFYTAAWKPTEDSPWTTGISAGVNRASFSNRPLGGSLPGEGGSIPPEPIAEEARVWRPFGSGNLWYTFSPRLTIGVETVAYAHHRFGEYLVQPNLTWRPTEHFFVQLGVGWYEVGGVDQASFMLRVNLLNPSRRKPRRDR